MSPKRWRNECLMIIRIFALIMALTTLAACSTPAPVVEPRARLAVAEAMAGGNADGFARATAPRPFTFPRDHGPHPEYAIEWWYYTGNLQSVEGRRFGFQFTIFRTGLMPGEAERSSAWASSSIYMAHFALSDISGGRFYAFERFSRGAAGLAGAQSEPFRVWLEDWSAEGLSADGTPMRLRAAEDGVALDLTLTAGKPPVLQGYRGLSQKSAEIGNASYYYSFTRMPISGTVRIGETLYQVSGLGWMDREWSTSALGEDQVGWDWFALHLDDGRDLMFYRLRLRNGGIDPYSKGVLVDVAGNARRLSHDEVLAEPLDYWTSPRSGATYPARWRLRVPDEAIDLTLTPLLADQELPVTVVYWEGAVAISGSATGSGYIEMTGYTPQDR
jgi:predicted secreted hydrolase